MPKRKLSNVFEKCKVDQEPSLNLSARTTRQSFLKKQKRQRNCQEEPSHKIIKCYLTLLPDEILEHILCYLSPRDLIVIAELTSNRIGVVAQKFGVADFQGCNDILPAEIASYFRRDRVEHIREINFNNVFRVAPVDLEKAIIRCNHLSSLSVMECGLTMTNIYKILCYCKELKELFWNVSTRDLKKCPKLKTFPLHMTKLYLQIGCNKDLNLACYLLRRCLPGSEICFNFTENMSSMLPFRTKNCTFQLHLKSNCRVNMVLQCLSDTSAVYIYDAIRKLNETGPDRGTCSWTITHPFLQLITRERDFSLTASIADESRHALVLCCTDRKFLVDNVDTIKRITGKNLTYLALRDMAFSPESNSVLPKPLAHVPMYDVLSAITTCCYNIKNLVLTNVHFTEALNFTALYNLKGLETLVFSSCAFNLDHLSHERPNRKLSNQLKQLRGFAKNCENVQNFSIYLCSECKGGPIDNDLAFMSGWKKLQTLNLIKLDTLYYCPFLKSMAKQCPDLRSVMLIEIGYPALSLHIDNLTYVLAKCPQLEFVSTSIEKSFVYCDRFWGAVGKAKNLQRLCLGLVETIEEVNSEIIFNAIKKLPILHIFHLHGFRLSDTFLEEVEKIMKNNGVKTADVKTSVICRLNLVEGL